MLYLLWPSHPAPLASFPHQSKILQNALHPLPSVALAGLMISELSAGCECRLFGTGLAWKCIRFHPKCYIPRQKIKKFSGEVAPWNSLELPILLPVGEGDTISPNPTSLAFGASILGASIDLLPLHFQHLPPPISHFWLWACLSQLLSFIMCNKCILSVMENKLLAVFSGGAKVPGCKSSRDRKFHTWNFRSRERMVLGAKSPVPLDYQ